MQTETLPQQDDRRLIAEVSRWRRANGWTLSDQRGWVNARCSADATIAVDYDAERPIGFTVARKDPEFGSWPLFPPLYEAVSVRQAVDLLVALDILPAQFSSAYKAGRDDALGDDWDGYCDYGYPIGGVRPRVDWCGLKRGHSGMHFSGYHEKFGFDKTGTVRRGGTR